MSGGGLALTYFYWRIRLVRLIDASDETRPYVGSDEQEVAMRLIRCFLADENGATAIEYGLIAAGIALAIVTVVNSTGGALLSNKFNSISAATK